MRIKHVIFTTYKRKRSDTGNDLFLLYTLVFRILLNSLSDNTSRLTSLPDIQQSYKELWKRFDPDADIKETSTIEEALELAFKISDQCSTMQALITGSQHMVGGALQIIEPNQYARETGLQPS